MAKKHHLGNVEFFVNGARPKPPVPSSGRLVRKERFDPDQITLRPWMILALVIPSVVAGVLLGYFLGVNGL